MQKMKYSGIEWIGEIPDNWDKIKIKNLCNKIYAGGTPSTDVFEYWDGDIPWLPSGACHDNIINQANIFITEKGYKNSSTKFIPKNTTIIAMTGATCANVGYITFDSCANQSVTAFVNNHNMLFSKYLFYTLQGARKYILTYQTGGAQAGINVENCRNLIIPITGIKEQKLIADFLDEKVNTIDNIISGLNNQIEILNKYKQRLMSEVVTKGLNKKVTMKDSEVGWIGSIPEHWNIKLIKNICSLKGRIGWEGLTKDEYISEGPTLITGINFDNGIINWDSCEHVSEWRYNQDKSIQIKNKDLLITKDGTVGKVAIVKDCPEKVTLNSGVLLLRPLNNEYIEKYLYYVLLSNEFWHWFEIENIGNTTIIHLYQNRFAKFKLALPPIDEQKEIVNYLDIKCSEIEEILNSKIKQKEQMEQYKKSVIYEYVTGKKRVKGAEELYG